MKILLALSLALASCTSDEATRSVRSINLVYGESSGSFSSHGGWKTSDDVWRGGSGGDMDVHSWSIGWSPFAYLEDPDVGRTNKLLSDVLRARAEQRPTWDVSGESTTPAAPVMPKAEDCGSSMPCSEAGAAPVETPARPVADLPFVEHQQLCPAPSKSASTSPAWWSDPVTVGGLVTLLVGVLGGRELHKRRRRRRAAHLNAISKEPVR